MPPVFIFHLAGSFGSDEEDETCPPFARHPVVPLPFGGGSTAYHMGVLNVHGTTWDSWMDAGRFFDFKKCLTSSKS